MKQSSMSYADVTPTLVMRSRYWIRWILLCSLGFCVAGAKEGVDEILSKNKTLQFEYDLKRNELESDKLSKSWINPIMVGYTRTTSDQFAGQDITSDNFTVTIDQPIFRSGGIYYAMKFADASRLENKTAITRQHKEMIADALSTLFQLKQNHLQQQKLKLLIANDKIDVKQKREYYQAGILGSSFLDQALLKKSQDEASLLALKQQMLEHKQHFALLSDKSPASIKLPTLKLMKKEAYKKHNLALKQEKYHVKKMAHQAKMTQAKYLPSVSIQAQYIDGDVNPLWAESGMKERYHTYGLRISLPIDINALKDIESSKLARLRAQSALLDTKQRVDDEYNWVEETLHIVNRRIALAKEDEKIYRSLYRTTRDLAKAGEKSKEDVAMMHNAAKIRRLDQQIYQIDKQLLLLKLYMRMDNAF